MTAKRTRLLLALAFALGGCTSARIVAPSTGISTVQLLYGDVLPAAPVPVSSDDLLELSPQMRAFADEHVAGRGGPLERWRALADALASPEHLELTYSDATKTAAEAFSGGHGNCLSYSAMLIALARYSGIQADFHEVDVPPDWTDRRGVLIRWRHVNVMVDLGPFGERIADFDSGADTTGYAGEVVPDSRAAAHFLNNLGVEQMEAGNIPLAFGYFRSAIEEEADFTPAWNNLGALYRREGFPAHAEAAYLHSLSLDSREFTAMNNLVRLYEIEGDSDAAAEYRDRVARYRDANPYYHFGLARRAFGAGDLGAAERHLRDAIRRKDDDHRFHLLRAEIMNARGHADRAVDSVRRAQSLVANSVP